MSAINTSGMPPIDQALLPRSVSTGSPAAKKAYEAALGFEQILVSQLSQELAATTSSSPSAEGSSTDGASGGSSSSNSSMGSDPANSMYAQLIPQAMTSSVMSAGGLGIAQELARSLDPSPRAKP